MATINGTSVGGMTLQADYSYTQNTSANTSTVTVVLKLINHYALYASALTGSYISVGGSKTNYSKDISYGGSATTNTTLTTKTVTVTHNSDGTATCNISGTFVMNGTYRGYSVGTMTVNQTITLPKIARSSSFTVSSSVNTGSAISGTVTPSSTAFNHKLLLKIGSTTKATITMAVGATTFSYTIPHDWFPSSTSGTISAVLETYNGTTLVATTSKNITANVPASIVPSVSAFTAAIAANGLSGLYVQGKTTAKLTATATAGSGSTIKSYTFSGSNVTSSGNSTTITANTVTTAAIKTAGTITYTVKVQDTRGRTASKTVSITVYPYAVPSIGPVSVQRCDSSGNISQSGTYAKYTLNSSYSSVGGKNTRTVTVAYSSNNGTSYSAETTLQAATDTTATKTGVYGSGAFALASTYLIKFTIKDAYGATKTITAPLQSAARPININWNGKGVSIGGMSTKEAFEVSMPAEFNNNVVAKGDLTVNGSLTLNSSFNHFGVGGWAKEVTGDWNTACGQYGGFYRGRNLANSPLSGVDWWYVQHIVHNAQYMVQIAYGYYSNSIQYQRMLSNGTWSAWRQVLFINHVQGVFNQTGYEQLPNGFILQWGLATIPANTSGFDVKFPITFPTYVRSVSCQNNYTNIRNASCSVSSMSATGFKMTPYITSSGGVPTVDLYVYWIAVGH